MQDSTKNYLDVLKCVRANHILVNILNCHEHTAIIVMRAELWNSSGGQIIFKLKFLFSPELWNSCIFQLKMRINENDF